MNRNLAEYYHWEEAERGIRVYMHAGMADRLQATVFAYGGREVGGILLGRIEDDRGSPITFIDDFVPVPCSYLDGPLYVLSDDDTVKLEAALLRAALAGCESPDAPSILGYYRSHQRDGLSLSAADLLVIDSYFQTPATVCLLVKAIASTKACTAGFFFWEDGRMEPEFSALEVGLGRTPANLNNASTDDLNDGLPYSLAELYGRAALPQSAGVRAVEPELSGRVPVVMAAPRAPSGRIPEAWKGVLLRIFAIFVAAALLAVAVVTYLNAPRPPREEAAVSTPATSTLGLQAERNPPDLLVTWNRYAREIVAARRAVLSIRDGRNERTVDLDNAHLAHGSFLGAASSDDILVRLEVYGADDGSVAQSIRVTLGRR